MFPFFYSVDGAAAEVDVSDFVGVEVSDDGAVAGVAADGVPDERL